MTYRNSENVGDTDRNSENVGEHKVPSKTAHRKCQRRGVECYCGLIIVIMVMTVIMVMMVMMIIMKVLMVMIVMMDMIQVLTRMIGLIRGWVRKPTGSLSGEGTCSISQSFKSMNIGDIRLKEQSKAKISFNIVHFDKIPPESFDLPRTLTEEEESSLNLDYAGVVVGLLLQVL